MLNKNSLNNNILVYYKYNYFILYILVIMLYTITKCNLVIKLCNFLSYYIKIN